MSPSLPGHEQAFSRYEEVTAALADPALVPLPAEPGPYGTVAWLRATVARFSAGEAHARRRALVLADLERLDPGALRILAAGGFEPDVRLRVVRVLAAALGLAEPEAVARDVRAVARAYFLPGPGGAERGGTSPGGAERNDAEADAAVARLLPAMGDADEETAANRIGLLVQACDATASLVEHVRRGTGGPAATLWDDPPVRTMRRVAARATEVAGVAVPAGAHVLLDLAAAQERDREPGREPLTFGAPPRLCPGRAQALAIAEGILYGASDPSDGSTPPERALGKAELAALIPESIGHVLTLAATWTAWDGRPIVNADGRTYTPHKAVRRITDHLLDHLAELEARLAGEPTEPDHWHASNVTTPADLAPFTAADLDEARSRLTRIGRIWAQRVAALPEERLDDSPGTGWSFRQIVCHLAGSSGYYADSVGAFTKEETR
ncbi:hypothetical protein [Kitasatospora sp. SUK 42]|uniref:hypothetical protein n=1 Tax=Kitasatospora sp. SUK 42 TaxID=1588882 RepID=UPI0027E3A352|nr:hypothetical protein [Kitasatospora sp. SUK 42]